MTKKRILFYLIFTWSFCLIILFTLNFYHKNYSHFKQTNLLEKQVKIAIADIGLNKKDDFHHNIDKTREYINQNSIHKIDEEFYQYWQKPLVMFELLNSGKKPKLECSTRRLLMGLILKQLGYNVRHVDIYKDLEDSHSFLEVQNPNNNKWEIQDPDYNIYWQSQERASTEDLLSNDLNNYKGDESLKSFFNLANIYGYKEKLVIINTDRFKPSREEFCHKYAKVCHEASFKIVP